MKHGEKEEESSQNMFLLYGVVQILQVVAPDFLNFMEYSNLMTGKFDEF